ncbi:MAG: hypothetical protein QOJ07_1838 [Thermoleophilaceae bacterium]|jgi:hypothetical protein|nr:hypothetical protein [Thermoleophilaceae bacterium]
MNAKQHAEWEQKYRDAVQPRLDEPLLKAGLFYRTGGFAALALGPFSGLAAVISRGVGKKRASGLPNQFLLAVTPTRVHAFKCSLGYGDVKAKQELAVWKRSGLQVTAEETTVNTRVTIESLPEHEKVICSTGKDPLSQSVIYAMQEPVGVAA